MFSRFLRKNMLKQFAKKLTKEQMYVMSVDFGYTYCKVALVDNKYVKIIENTEGQRATPIYVATKEDGEFNVGSGAKNQALQMSGNTFYDLKNIFGRYYEDKFIQNKIQKVNYKITNDEGEILLETDKGQKFESVELAAEVFKTIKENVGNFLGFNIDRVLLTNPVYFNKQQKADLRRAAELAGLNVIKTMTEPVAACYAYSIDRDLDLQHVIVYDFGGSQFDVTVMKVLKGQYEVLTTISDINCGGYNIDEAIVDYVVQEFKKESGIDISQESMSLQRVREAAEKTKLELTKSLQSDINLPFLAADSTGPKHYATTVTRQKFEQLIKPLVDNTLQKCDDALTKSNLVKKDLSEIVLVGGSSKIPGIQKAVERHFVKTVKKEINPDEVIAIGGSMYGLTIKDNEKKFRVDKIVPLSIGVVVEGGLFDVIIDCGTPIPCKKKVVYAPCQDGQDSISFKIYQGERLFAEDNVFLGQFEVDGLDQRDRGVIKIELTFDVDKNGVMIVTSHVLETDNIKKTSMLVSGKFYHDSQVDEYLEHYADHMPEDTAKLEQMLRKRGLELQIYRMEQTIRDFGYRYSDKTKKDVEWFIEKAKKIKEKRGNLITQFFILWMDAYYYKMGLEEFSYNYFNRIIDPHKRLTTYRDERLSIEEEYKLRNARDWYYTYMRSIRTPFEQEEGIHLQELRQAIKENRPPDFENLKNDR